MENGGGGCEREVVLTEKMSGLGLSDSTYNNYSHNNESLYQVMKALDAAEATIKQQVEENTRLRNELQNNVHLQQKHKSDEPTAQRPHSFDTWKEQLHGPYNIQSVPSVDNQQDNFTKMVNNSRADPSGMLVLHQDSKSRNDDPTYAAQTHLESHPGSSMVNGPSKVLPSGQEPVDNSGLHRSSSPSSSVSPNRYIMEGENHSLPHRNTSRDGLLQMAEMNNNDNLWKQDVLVKVREHEEEIMQLRRQLSDYSVKEAQVRNEKYVLEKRIAYMRLAFDQQQQDLVDAASKALSYRQDIIEENIRLTYELQAAQQERSTFVSSFLPLLAEYKLQPPVLDAQSIVSNVKILFRHLQEKLILTESKLKESQYQLAPWRSDVNNSNYAPQSPSHSIGAALTTMNKNGLELVPQHAYSHGKMPMTSADTQPAASWEFPSHHESGLGSNVTKNLDEGGMYSPLASRNSSVHEAPTQFAVTRGDTQTVRYAEETANKQVIFRDPVSSSDMDDFETEGHQSDRESSAQWGPGNSNYSASVDDPNSSYSPYLPPVLEEPSSSFSEAADDDPLPGIEGLQISGEAFPGRELQACGYSTNGTTSCNFEWVRHLEDGSVNYIEGAKQPNYLVTADDVDTYLAIEVQPLDDRKRKGELVKVFANEHKKISCDLEMHDHIQKTLYAGHVSFKVSLSTGYIDIWEPATLAIKREGYSIKCSGPSGGVVTEKFSPATSVTIPYGHAAEFIIFDSSGHQHLLQADSSEDISCSRDTIVLTLRLFIKQFGERRKGKKRGLFFNK